MTAILSRKEFLIILIAALNTFPFARAQDGKSEELTIIEAAATKELKVKEGQKVIVHGVTAGSGKSQSGTNFVNFKGAEFYLITFKSDLEPFELGEPADAFDGKRIAVTGVISVYRDKPQIKLTNPDQVRVLKEGETFPPEKPKDSAAATGDDAETRIAASAEASAAPEPEKPKEVPPVDWRRFFK